MPSTRRPACRRAFLFQRPNQSGGAPGSHPQPDAVPKGPCRSGGQHEPGQPDGQRSLRDRSVGTQWRKAAPYQGHEQQARRRGQGETPHHQGAAQWPTGQRREQQSGLQQAAGPGHPGDPDGGAARRHPDALPSFRRRCRWTRPALPNALKPHRLLALPEQPQAQRQPCGLQQHPQRAQHGNRLAGLCEPGGARCSSGTRGRIGQQPPTLKCRSLWAGPIAGCRTGRTAHGCAVRRPGKPHQRCAEPQRPIHHVGCPRVFAAPLNGRRQLAGFDNPRQAPGALA